MQERSAFDIAMLVFAAVAAVAGVVTVLPLFGFDLRIIGRPKVPLDQGSLRVTKRAWLALVLVIVSLGLSTGAFYYFFHPRIVEKPVEKTVESPCPEQKTPAVTPVPSAKPLKGTEHVEANPIGAWPKAPQRQTGIQQSNSGGLNILQGTTGENSPIINSPVTVGNVPRHISPDDMRTLQDYLSTAKLRLAPGIELRISADQYTRPSPLVDEFYTIFNNAHWPMKDVGVGEIMAFSSPTVKKFQGAVVTIKGEPIEHDGDEITVIEPDPLYYIGTVLKTLKVPITLKRDRDAEAGLIVVQFEGGLPN